MTIFWDANDPDVVWVDEERWSIDVLDAVLKARDSAVRGGEE